MKIKNWGKRQWPDQKQRIKYIKYPQNSLKSKQKSIRAQQCSRKQKTYFTRLEHLHWAKGISSSSKSELSWKQNNIKHWLESKLHPTAPHFILIQKEKGRKMVPIMPYHFGQKLIAIGPFNTSNLQKIPIQRFIKYFHVISLHETRTENERHIRTFTLNKLKIKWDHLYVNSNKWSSGIEIPKSTKMNGLIIQTYNAKE